jgi:hypothetical protein
MGTVSARVHFRGTRRVYNGALKEKRARLIVSKVRGRLAAVLVEGGVRYIGLRARHVQSQLGQVPMPVPPEEVLYCSGTSPQSSQLGMQARLE